MKNVIFFKGEKNFVMCVKSKISDNPVYLLFCASTICKKFGYVLMILAQEHAKYFYATFMYHFFQISNLVSKIQECEKYISETRQQYNTSQLELVDHLVR